jgi:hypothetical protein
MRINDFYDGEEIEALLELEAADEMRRRLLRNRAWCRDAIRTMIKDVRVVIHRRNELIRDYLRGDLSPELEKLCEEAFEEEMSRIESGRNFIRMAKEHLRMFEAGLLDYIECTPSNRN